MKELPQLQAIQQLGRTYRAFLSAFEATIGHSMPRWRILLRLYQAGELSQKQLARDLALDPASLTRQIKVVEQLGWVERHSDPFDNRLTNVALTEAGLVVVRDTMPRRLAFIENAFGELTPDEVGALSDMLGKLERHLLSDLADALAAQEAARESRAGDLPPG